MVTEARTARESSFVENVGTYNPRSKPANVQINKERVKHWLSKGARPSDSVRTLLEKHLSRDLSAPPIEPRGGAVMSAPESGSGAMRRRPAPAARYARSLKWSSARWSTALMRSVSQKRSAAG